MAEIPIWFVSAFVSDLLGSDRPILGNPAAVVVLAPEENSAREETWRQRVALEMNVSETAFVVAREDGDFDLRWFTPQVEVDLCGHATLAAAYVLWDFGYLPTQHAARFHTRSGLLIARSTKQGIELDFPIQKTTPCELTEGLRVPIGLKTHEILGVERAHDDLLIEMSSQSRLEALAPDFGALRVISQAQNLRGVIVTARAEDTRYDFLARFFAPGVGINEDPVTGSAYTKLAPFWAGKLGKTTLTAFQASPRGGILHLRLDGERVYITGEARLSLRGELFI